MPAHTANINEPKPLELPVKYNKNIKYLSTLRLLEVHIKTWIHMCSVT